MATGRLIATNTVAAADVSGAGSELLFIENGGTAPVWLGVAETAPAAQRAGVRLQAEEDMLLRVASPSRLWAWTTAPGATVPVIFDSGEPGQVSHLAGAISQRFTATDEPRSVTVERGHAYTLINQGDAPVYAALAISTPPVDAPAFRVPVGFANRREITVPVMGGETLFLWTRLADAVAPCVLILESDLQ